MCLSLVGSHIKRGKSRSRSPLAVVKADYALAFAVAELYDVAPSNAPDVSLAFLFGEGGDEFEAPRVGVSDADLFDDVSVGETGLTFRDFTATLPLISGGGRLRRPTVTRFCDLDPADRQQLQMAGIR